MSSQSIIPGFKGDIVTPDHADFDTLIQRWAKNTVKRPLIVACVKDEEDIQLAIQYAKASGIDLAVKCGGHNTSGASSSDGLVIDVSRYLTSVEILPEKKLIHMGGGCTWKEAEATAMKHGLMAVSGTYHETGVGGYTLAGGYGFLTGQHGLAIDSLVAATVVTGTGEIIKTSEDNEPDLLWGIRGGGSNFGVVSSFTFRLHDQRPTVYFGRLSFHPDKLLDVFQAVRTWYASVPDPKSAVQVSFTGTKPFLNLVLFYNGSKEEGEEYFKEFLEIPSLTNDSSDKPYIDVNAHDCNNTNIYMKGASGPVPSNKVVQNAFKLMMDIKDQRGLGKDSGFPAFTKSIVFFEYYPSAKKASVPAWATAYVHRTSEPLTSILIRWDDYKEENTSLTGPEADLGNYNMAKKFAHSIMKAIMDGQVGTDVTTESEAGTTRTAETLFGANYPRLQQIKARYDPEMVFKKWFPIIPAKVLQSEGDNKAPSL